MNYKLSNAQIARVAYEIHLAYCHALGDHSQPQWPDAPEWSVQSAIKAVQFHRENPTATPSMTHQSWMDERLADGWEYGPTKDVHARTHPCLVPYEQLPIHEQIKDALFAQVVRSLLRLSGPHVF